MALKVAGGKRKYKLGDQYSSDFDYDGMLAMFRRALAGQMSVPDMERLSDSMEDVNYHTDNRKLRAKIDEMKGGKSDGKVANPLTMPHVKANLDATAQAMLAIYTKAQDVDILMDRVEAAMGKTNPNVQGIVQRLAQIRALATKVDDLAADIWKKAQQ